VKGHKIPATGKGRCYTLGFERFLYLFFKNIISIFNALHVFYDEIFFNIPCQLQAFDYFVVNLTHASLILRLQVLTVVNKSTNLESRKVVGRSIC